MPKASTNTLSGNLKEMYTDVSQEYGADGNIQIAYNGPILDENGGQPGVIGSLVDKRGGAIYLYTSNETHPHYTITDGNPHYTNESNQHFNIKNQNVIDFLTNYGGYQAGGGSKKKRKTRRRKSKRKTSKRKTSKRKTSKKKTSKKKTSKRKTNKRGK